MSGGQQKKNVKPHFTRCTKKVKSRQNHKMRKTDTVGDLRHSNTTQCRNMCKRHFSTIFLCGQLKTYDLWALENRILMPKKCM